MYMIFCEYSCRVKEGKLTNSPVGDLEEADDSWDPIDWESLQGHQLYLISSCPSIYHQESFQKLRLSQVASYMVLSCLTKTLSSWSLLVWPYTTSHWWHYIYTCHKQESVGRVHHMSITEIKLTLFSSASPTLAEVTH